MLCKDLTMMSCWRQKREIEDLEHSFVDVNCSQSGGYVGFASGKVPEPVKSTYRQFLFRHCCCRSVNLNH